MRSANVRRTVLFYVLLFSILGLFVIVVGVATMTRRNREMRRDEHHTPRAARTKRKSERAESRRGRRKRK